MIPRRFPNSGIIVMLTVHGLGNALHLLKTGLILNLYLCSLYLLAYYGFNLFIAEHLLRAQCNVTEHNVTGLGFNENQCAKDTLRQ